MKEAFGGQWTEAGSIILSELPIPELYGLKPRGRKRRPQICVQYSLTFLVESGRRISNSNCWCAGMKHHNAQTSAIQFCNSEVLTNSLAGMRGGINDAAIDCMCAECWVSQQSVLLSVSSEEYMPLPIQEDANCRASVANPVGDLLDGGFGISHENV